MVHPKDEKGWGSSPRAAHSAPGSEPRQAGARPLVERVAAFGMTPVAVTDQSALFSLVKSYRAAQARGVNPIIGADLWVESPAGARGGAPERTRIVALCQNQSGYRNLTRLVTRSYTEGQSQGIPPAILPMTRCSRIPRYST